ncbi:MAG: tetratricopeptide repeat protein [Melioribacteraceae bacterium]|nr:tetratricopeptide repeat protein [Melioribacteraceae bacterium]
MITSIMNEMLGNQYFIARRFSEACNALEAAYLKNPLNFSIKKKLIICYLQTDQFEKAFQSFYELISDNIEIIMNTDMLKDDCPCPEIIDQTIPELKSNSEAELIIKLGILWLYCDLEKSIHYFEKVPKTHQYYQSVNKILQIEKSQQTKRN